MAKIKTVDPDKVFGEGDWRPVLGKGPRELGWKFNMIGKQSIEERLRGIIIPSFDAALDTEDKAFQASVTPCWSDTPDTNLKRHFAPTQWFFPIIMYPYLGEAKEHWLSPKNLINMIGSGELSPGAADDAFDDLNKWVRRSKELTEGEKEKLLKVKKLSDDPIVPGRATRVFSLSECRDKDNDWHLAAIGYTSSALSYMLEQMRWRAEDDCPPLDPDFPRYMLGDVTRVGGAVVWHVDKIQLNAKDTHDTNVICFTNRPEFLDENQETRPVSEDILLKRFNMQDPACWNIPTYEEQVMHMVERFAPEVTSEMIRAACGHRCEINIPDRKVNRTISNGGGGNSERGQRREDPPTRSESRRERETRDEDDDPMAAVTGRSMTPNSAPPMPKVDVDPAPASRTVNATAQVHNGRPAAADDGTKYWAGGKGGKAEKLTVTELQARVDNGDYEGIKVQIDGKWVAIEDCGLVQFPVVEEEAPIIPDDEPPFVPGDDEPPMVPDDSPSSGAEQPAGGGLTREVLCAQLFPDREAFESYSEERKARAWALVEEAYVATDAGRNIDVPGELIDKMLALQGE